MKEKVCRTCGESKPLTDFYQHAGTKDGYINHCIKCSTQAQRTAYYINRAKKTLLPKPCKNRGTEIKEDIYLSHMTKFTCSLLNVPFDIIFEKHRGADFVMVRALVAYAARDAFGSSLSSKYIAKYFKLQSHDGSVIRHHMYKLDNWVDIYTKTLVAKTLKESESFIVNGNLDESYSLIRCKYL